MAKKLSRRVLAKYMADELVKKDSKHHDLALRRLAAYLIESKRTDEALLIVRDVEHELMKRGVVIARITSSGNLSGSLQKSIAEFTKRQTSAKTVVTEMSVDKSLLGGFKLDLPGKQIDRTIANQLMTLRTKFKKV